MKKTTTLFHIYICEFVKTKTQISFPVTLKLTSIFDMAAGMVQFLNFLNPKFAASIHLLWLHSLICVRTGRNPHCWFSHDAAHNSEIKKTCLTVSRIMRKPLFCTAEKKDADQLGSNCTANQCPCFYYTDSTIFLLVTFEISSF